MYMFILENREKNMNRISWIYPSRADILFGISEISEYIVDGGTCTCRPRHHYHRTGIPIGMESNGHD